MPFLSLGGWLPAAILCLGLATEAGKARAGTVPMYDAGIMREGCRKEDCRGEEKGKEEGRKVRQYYLIGIPDQ